MFKITLALFFILTLLPSLNAQSYQLKDRYGRNNQVIVKPRCIIQRDRVGRNQSTYKVYGNRIYQYNQKGQRR